MKINNVLKKLRTMRYKEFYNRAKEIGSKNNKSTFSVLFDMAKCAFKYGSGYMDYFEFEFYLLNDKERETYLTGRYNSEIVRKYNPIITSKDNRIFKIIRRFGFNSIPNTPFFSISFLE